MMASDAASSPSLMRLAICAAGIGISYCVYGLLQESLFTGVHLGPTFTLVTACIMNVLVAVVWECAETKLLLRQAKTSERKKNDDDTGGTTRTTTSARREAVDSLSPPSHLLPHKLLVMTSFFYVLAMTCSNEAIPHVSYPVAVLAKSCKLIPTMLVGQFLERKSYSSAEWLAALCISLGITLFHSTQWQAHGQDHQGADPTKRRLFGMVLLVISLLSDGILSSCQNLIKNCSSRDATRKPPSAVQTMYYVNLYALVFLVPLATWNGQLTIATIERVLWTEPTLSWNLLLLNTAVGLGQVFIFLTITWYSPVICTTITTTRKFVTILLSVYAFGHSFSLRQWLAIALVFSGLYTVILVQHQKQQQSTTTDKEHLHMRKIASSRRRKDE